MTVDELKSLADAAAAVTQACACAIDTYREWTRVPIDFPEESMRTVGTFVRVMQCTVCGRCALRYVEAGGYYVEPRIRTLDPRLIVDVPAPD